MILTRRKKDPFYSIVIDNIWGMTGAFHKTHYIAIWYDDIPILHLDIESLVVYEDFACIDSIDNI